MKNTSLAKWKSGNKSLGAWISLSDVYATETLARMGFDWLCFDLQHGLISYTHLLNLIPALSGTGVTPLARVSRNDAGEIGRVLDAGTQGVIVPLVNTAEEAAAAAAACRYPPRGHRSFGPLRAMLLDGPAYISAANDETACIAMVETEEGLRNVRAIAATPGIDAIFVGPMDLSFGLGIKPGDFDNPRFTAALRDIREACDAAGCAAGIYGYSAEAAYAALAQGFTFASAGNDSGFLREGATAALKIAGATPDTHEQKTGY
tara:strand:+ start:4287 stop:5072 length:786 start_codon:yes stop_codon:yes gene_type:complete